MIKKNQESYLYKAALSELRTEVQILRRNDSQLLQAEAVMMTREVEALKQEVNEGLAMLKNEVALEMNNRKNETREVQQGVDMRIQELNNHLTVMLGDMRTEIEAIRWETIWKTLGNNCQSVCCSSQNTDARHPSRRRFDRSEYCRNRLSAETIR